MDRLRQYFRRTTPEITVDTAQKWKRKLSVIYALAAWNAFGLLMYSMAKDSFPKTNESIDYIKLLGVKDAKIIKLSGFNMVQDYDVNLTDEQIKEYHQKDNSDKSNKENEV